ncbi:osteopontin isoform X1 [Aquila chrysaetos chrysaetos]|uniref:osteopontin isoform X1 n=1 Tax=Aquila chrysaetos chrysaetos TaxID=223781 RepID=UPI0011771C87|nr:osteopontin isoform X1 [Aquila chrysaetos chrysaetos]
MKAAVLCLCLISITAAWPVSKYKQHAISASSEEKYDPRGHHSHRYHHHHHMNSQSWESLQHTQNDLMSPQQTLYSSDESVDVPVQPHFPDVSSKSHEDVDDDNDDNDSNDTDESDEVVTSFPTDIPVTVPFPPFPFTRGDNAGRGDSVAYRVRAKATVVESSKLRKAAKKLIVYDASEEDESALDADSQQTGLSREDPAAHHSLGKHAISREWADKSHGQDSSELDSKQHDRSMENDSRQKFDSHEAEGDDSKAGVRGDSYQTMESRESQVRVSAEIPDDNSNQTLESAEDARDHHSIENNEVTL